VVEEFPRYWDGLQLLRKLIIGESWIIHILIATFTLGAGLIAPTIEAFGVVRKDPRYDRFAYGLATANVVLYAVGATMAVAGMFFTWGFFPTFFATLWWQFFWGMFATEMAWVGELVIILVYYFTWNRLKGRGKPIHILIGALWLPMSLLQQAFLFPMVDFLMTPDVQQPFFNPSVIPQLAHRFMGNISWAGFVIAFFGGLQVLRHIKKGPREKVAFWDWVGSLGIIFGMVFMVGFMTFSGYSWVIAAKGSAPGAFFRMMISPLAWMFQLQVFFFGMTIFFASLYMYRRLKVSGNPTYGLKWITALVALFWLLGSIPYYIGPGAEQMWVSWTIPLGAMRPWKYIALGGMSFFGLVAILAYLQSARDGLNWGASGRIPQRALITVGILGLFMMMTMGIIRETAKMPGVIYGIMNSQEQLLPPQIVPQEDVHRPNMGPFGR
jgi:cytochrome bd ubiquinol oxidase subunit I